MQQQRTSSSLYLINIEVPHKNVDTRRLTCFKHTFTSCQLQHCCYFCNLCTPWLQQAAVATYWPPSNLGSSAHGDLAQVFERILKRLKGYRKTKTLHNILCFVAYVKIENISQQYRYCLRKQTRDAAALAAFVTNTIYGDIIMCLQRTLL